MKALKTNSKEVKTVIQQHILNCVYDCSENKFPSLKLACTHLNNEFIRVAGHEYNLRKFPNHVGRFIDYLQGMPFHFEYENCEIENFINNLGVNPDKKNIQVQKVGIYTDY